MKDNPYVSHLKMARSQRRKLERIADKLTDMSREWDGCSGAMEADLCDLADKVYEQLATHHEQIENWRKGYA